MDGTPAMTGLKSGFIKKEKNSSLIGMHCILYPEALA